MKRLTAILLSFFMVFSLFTFAPATLRAEEIHTDSTGSYQYVCNGRYAKIVKYLGTIEMDAEKTYTLPSELDGHTVNEIGADAFAEYSAPSKRIVIPDTVSAIDDRAFEFVLDAYEEYPITKGVRLEEVTLPTSLVYIGDCVFASNNLRAVTIPGSVKYLGKRCFTYNGLESLIVEEGVKRIHDEAFRNCYKLREISLPSTLMSIGREAFQDMGMYSPKGTLHLVIPDAVTEIGDNAFDSAWVIGTVKLGAGLEVIGAEAFSCCSSLKSIDASNCRNLYRIGEEAFEVCSSLKTFAVNEPEEFYLDIGDRAFYSCPAMRSITVPDSTYFGKESVGYIYNKNAKGYVLTDKLTVNCISSGSFKPSKYYTDSQQAVYSLYENVGLKANFIVKATDTKTMKFNDGTKFRLVIEGNTGLKWKSSKPKVARISANGSVATLSGGTTTLTTTLNNGKKYTCKLKVVALAK